MSQSPKMTKRQHQNLLVGGFNPSGKYYSVGIIIPKIWKNKKCSKPPTSLNSSTNSEMGNITTNSSW